MKPTNVDNAIVLGVCARCADRFLFDPVLVPSVNIGGQQRPLCEPCFSWLKLQRHDLPKIDPNAWPEQAAQSAWMAAHGGQS